MDADRFDFLTKTVFAASRRGLLGAALGGTLLGCLSGVLAADRKQGYARRGAGDEKAGAAECRPAGSPCARPGQCCTKSCLGGKVCSCNRRNRCPKPANSCKRAVCKDGRCVKKKRQPGSACTSDDNPCTDDVCNDRGQCTHPNTPNHTACGSEQSCLNGVCTRTCEIDDDCPEQTESCQSGHCRPVCTAASCPGATCHCAVEHQDDGTRQAVCYARLLTEELPCGNCGNEAPTCVIRAEDTNCPSCKKCAAVEPCSCSDNGECPGATTSCQNGTCQPVCTAQSCPGDTCHCAIHYESNGDRTAVCYSTITPSENPCGDDGNCMPPFAPAGSICVVLEDRTDCGRVSFCSDCSVLTPCA